MAIAAATGISYAKVHSLCERHGWDEEAGMTFVQAASLLREMGVSIEWICHPMLSGATLRRFREKCDQNASYFITTDNHALAIVKGRVRDPYGSDEGDRVIFHGKIVGVSGSPVSGRVEDLEVGLIAKFFFASEIALLRGARKWRPDDTVSLFQILTILSLLAGPAVFAFTDDMFQIAWAIFTMSTAITFIGLLRRLRRLAPIEDRDLPPSSAKI